MELSKKIALIVVINAFFMLFVNTPISAACDPFNCTPKRVMCVGILGGVISLIMYKIGWAPYERVLPLPNPNLSAALKNLYNDPKVNAKKYNEAPTLASHNSFTYPSDEVEWLSLQTVLLQNQILNIPEQLEFGVRTFLLDIYTDTNNPNDAIKLSHGDHDFGCAKQHTLSYTKNWNTTLEEIEDFLSKNPNEIITIFLESCVKSYDKIMRDLHTTKLDNYLYIVKNGATDWDTREEMIKNNQRLVIFSEAYRDDVGPGIMGAKHYILENHYEKVECEHRDFGRLELPKQCTPPPVNMGAYQCIKTSMAKMPLGLNNNKGAIIFLMNQFQLPSWDQMVLRLLPVLSEYEIRDYYRLLNSYDAIQNSIKQCCCEFKTSPAGIPQPPIKMELGTYPDIIALDFLGEDEVDDGARGIIRDMLLNNFTIPAC